MSSDRKRKLLRVGLLSAVVALLILSVLSPLLERPAYLSRQGPWARAALGQPLPLRIFNTIGRWSVNSTNPSLAKRGEESEVTYVKMTAVGQTLEEFTGHTEPECSADEKARGCVVWASRSEQHRKNSKTERKAEEGTAAHSLTGIIVTHFDGKSTAAMEKSYFAALRMTLQAGSDIGAEAYDMNTISQWNESDTTTTERGVLRWVSFGVRKDYGVRRLQSIFPVESGVFEQGASSLSAKERQRKTKEGNQAAVSYFRGTLNSTDAVKLFRDLYLKNVADAEEAHKKDKTPGKGVALSYNSVLSGSCFWLSEVVYQELNNADGMVSGRAWSTCGDRITWVGSADSFDALLSETNLAAFLVLFTTALPMVIASYYQMNWMSNSRTRMLRVNPYQLMFTGFMLSFSTYLLSAGGSTVPSAVTRIIASSKSTFLLYGVACFAEMQLFVAYFTVDREFTRYFQASENAQREASRRIFVFFFLVWLAPGVVAGLGGLHNPWITGILAALFWLPQYYHCFAMDGWTGLTAPFILANLSLVITPILVPLLAPAPWTLPRSHVIALQVSASILLVEGALLLAIRLKDGKNLLPRWMAPWRHVYKTTPEAQSAALLENPLCPICCNQLSEGWDDRDELWRTPCNHLFHRSCLERWMQERTECPLCRKLLPEP